MNRYLSLSFMIHNSLIKLTKIEIAFLQLINSMGSTLRVKPIGAIMKPIKLKVIADYKSPYPESIKFEKGEQVKIGEKFDKDSDWDNSYWCEGQQKNKAWVPIQYIDFDGDIGTINTPYDAKELSIHKGEILKTLEEINGFTMAINSRGMKGWVPLKNLGAFIE